MFIPLARDSLLVLIKLESLTLPGVHIHYKMQDYHKTQCNVSLIKLLGDVFWLPYPDPWISTVLRMRDRHTLSNYGKSFKLHIDYLAKVVISNRKLASN